MMRPIGLFDSGLGGLSVMKELIRKLPYENMVYFGDSAHLPFGNKSKETILSTSLECSRFLMDQDIKLLVIACHTACSYALESIQEMLPIPVIGVIDPGIAEIEQFERVAILATTGTIQSGVYQSKIRPETKVTPIACPLFVPLVEEGFHNHPAAKMIAESYLLSIVGKVDAALLGCTHYPFLKETLQSVLGSDIKLIEPAKSCAETVSKYLLVKNLLNRQTTNPHYQFFTSDDPKKFQMHGEFFLGSTIENVEKKQEIMKLF